MAANCANCGNPITTSVVSVNGAVYHPEHVPAAQERSFRETVRLTADDVGVLDFPDEAATKERELR